VNAKSFFQFFKFAIFSLSAGIIEVVSFTVFNELLDWKYWPAYLLGLTLSVLWNFTLNRRYTFKSAANIPVAMVKVLCFYLVFTPLSTWLGDLAEKASVNEYIILAVTMVMNFLLEFLFCKFVVYRNQEDTLPNTK